ncbi:MAG: SDR family NAD(P)-dependent oxidoreductase [Verrucomicrobia bacterium]|nr:SDR family NAD(P)-dependent oxidoreductase [Verrucomicrobiota bacterium]MBU1857826.1 SDR family NAD(P)-dependent oxidoreductase [Verrucomicrobiota bacterium]
MLAIKGAVAVITGGSGGIGMALARYWLDHGGRVVLADISEEALLKVQAVLGGETAVFMCDVTKEGDNSRLADFVIEKFGQINLVAPFAGIFRDCLLVSPDRETGRVVRKMALEDFKKVIDINLTGVFLTVRECLERMINNKNKGLICLASSTGSLGTAGQINYSATKAAMSVFPKVIAAELFRRGLGGQIRCVAVAPGYCDTPMARSMNPKAFEKILENVPIGRLIGADEVASLVGELYRNEALTGDVYFIHGGLRLGSKG